MFTLGALIDRRDKFVAEDGFKKLVPAVPILIGDDAAEAIDVDGLETLSCGACIIGTAGIN
jgi:hypothetical protein